ncbi:MAG: hypothetical protein Q9169_005079 [Polycauliona sp. 2 TL-2023]
MDPYIYTPLNEEIKEIRLLTLLPDNFDAPIHISVQNTILSESEVPEFEALSYAWGDALDRAGILVEARAPKRSELERPDDIDSTPRSTLSITNNLFDALKHLRLKDQTRVFWIDAICVDQMNLEERGNQVLRMPDIFSSAKAVAVWLGPEGDDSSNAMEVIRCIGSRITLDWGLPSMASVSESDFDPYAEEEYNAVEPTPKERLSIDKLLGRAWFERLWVVQEIYLGGKNAHVVCGFVKISYQDFSNGAYYLIRWHEPKDPHSVRLWARIEDLLVLSNRRGPSRLESVLDQTRQNQCSDQRDRIFAVLSLVPEYERLEIRPNYTVSVTEVFQRLVLQQAKCHAELNTLRFCSIDDRITDIPTWAPDWTSSSSTQILPTSWASTSTKAHSYSKNQGILVATGCCVTVVNEVKHIFSGRKFTDKFQSARAIGKLISTIIGKETNNASVEFLRSFCRTLCAAGFTEKYVPAIEGYPSCEASVRYITDCYQWLRDPATGPPEQDTGYINYVNFLTNGKKLVTATDGRLGLVPRATEPGDEVCVILGCSSPLILRSAENGGAHNVVGECYLDGIMAGEALLGELPEHWTHVKKYYPDDFQYVDCYRDGNTGETQLDDPRLGPLPAGWRIKSHRNENAYSTFNNDETGKITRFDPRLEPDMLKARGVELQEFRLV